MVETDPTARHTLTRVVTVAGAMTKKTNAAMLITVPGQAPLKETKLQGAGQVHTAQSWAVRFNVISADAAREPSTPGLAAEDPAGPPAGGGYRRRRRSSPTTIGAAHTTVASVPTTAMTVRTMAVTPHLPTDGGRREAAQEPTRTKDRPRFCHRE